MTITLTRVDDRVIHGQIMTRWTKVRPVDGILVVGDNIASDELRKRVLKAAAGTLKIGIYTVEQGVDKIKQGMESTKNFFLISDSPQTFEKLLRAGAKLNPTLNIGCMNTREGAKVLGRTVAIDENDYKAFEYIEAQGIKIEFQLLPDDEPKSWSIMKKKYDTL
ncbi:MULTISPECIES: PTS system mannose/fructose/N-acetylgalactosamine-transporter subunit IIB [unclassified Gilliamella]|uniref:PTS system mannose/fructose/N-acetylgalactosamine-transporter subunit IIB n=1 Tax=unclassified Gilliamella TaxID=2685620 RepID=UPI0013216BD0|nr:MULTISPECIES: PTS sugar transporter subunit IIB [unclassified Gilliamella]MWN32451.1 PTS mannose/fructose/sorbose transporter subunit IIB [Gilliamella sp. Pra-s60]MWP29838.1 PTS mannose/fructose/sorbose transporter subunit IIB [Gilliamella sp. Pra-s54]